MWSHADIGDKLPSIRFHRGLSFFSTGLDAKIFCAGCFPRRRRLKPSLRLSTPDDKPDVERVRNTQTGGRDQWRKE
jgi:hypothetical protein